ncbi:hypothetical protein ACERII_09855 [Evansella sp. AB-rgal1]
MVNRYWENGSMVLDEKERREGASIRWKVIFIRKCRIAEKLVVEEI